MQYQEIIKKLQEQDPTLESIELSDLNTQQVTEILALAKNSNIKTLKIIDSEYSGTCELPFLLEKLEVNAWLSINSYKNSLTAITKCVFLKDLTISCRIHLWELDELSKVIEKSKSLEKISLMPANKDVLLSIQLISALEKSPSVKQLELRAYPGITKPYYTTPEMIDGLQNMHLEVLLLDNLTTDGAIKLAELLRQDKFLPAIRHVKLNNAACKYVGALELMKAWLYRSELTMEITEAGLKKNFIMVLNSEEYQTDIKNYLSGILPNGTPVSGDNVHVADKIYDMYQIFKGNTNWYYSSLPKLHEGNANINLALLLNRFFAVSGDKVLDHSFSGNNGHIKMITSFIPNDEQEGLTYVYLNLAGELAPVVE